MPKEQRPEAGPRTLAILLEVAEADLRYAERFPIRTAFCNPTHRPSHDLSFIDIQEDMDNRRRLHLAKIRVAKLEERQLRLEASDA